MRASNLTIHFRPGAALALGLVVAVAACSPANKYQNANRSQQFLATDVASCNTKASDLVSRELDLDRSYDKTGGESLEVSFASFDARKQRSRYFENCMSQRDYTPVSAKPTK